MKKTFLSLFIILFAHGLLFTQELGRRPNLGVSLRPLTPEKIKQLNYTGDEKTFVQKVFPNTTASSLKIMADDIMLDYAGVKIGPGYYNKIKAKYREGDDITAKVFRNGKIAFPFPRKEFTLLARIHLFTSIHLVVSLLNWGMGCLQVIHEKSSCSIRPFPQLLQERKWKSPIGLTWM